MPLAPGTRLGEYEILALLGSGGMGEVYRARDPRLGREVAIKVLTSEASTDRGLLQRLQQEARTVAALNHPNLLAIYDMGTHQGAPFLVMELLSGESLRARLQRGPLSPRAAVSTGLEIARGLAAAHEQSVIHRDLKPENIFLLSDGRAKILDFGLAKSGTQEAVAEAQTIAASAATLPGMVMGTVGYMAPEQVRGEPATPRSDIFAFGTILYEMLAGKRAFSASSAMEVMSAILRDDAPELGSSIALLPPGLERIIRRCLEKDPKRRFQSAADLEFALLNLESGTTSGALPAVTASGATPALVTSQSRRRSYLAIIFATLIAVALTCLFTLDRAPTDITRITYTPFAPEAESGATGHWSPDGAAIAFAGRATASGADQVFVRYLNAPSANQLTNIDNLNDVLGWSADGHSILYDDQAKIWSIAPVGGAPQMMCDLSSVQSSLSTIAVAPQAWAAYHTGPDGKFGLFISPPGGQDWRPYSPAPFTSSNLVNQPQFAFSPDGTQILLFVNGARGREEAWLLPWPASPRHPPHQIFLHAPPQTGTPHFSWLPDSRHILLAAQPANSLLPQIFLADVDSSSWQQLTAGIEPTIEPAAAPDGSAGIIAQIQGHFDVDTVRLSDAVVSPLLANGADNNMPAWALHAPNLVYESRRSGAPSLWIHAAGAQVTERPLSIVTKNQFFLAPVLSPNADRVIFSGFGLDNGAVPLFIASVNGGNLVPLLATPPGIDAAAAWSPDGSQAAYIHIHGNIGDLMVASTGGGATPRLLHGNINSLIPVWSPDGAWIAFQASDNSMHLISPDGQHDRSLGKLDTHAIAFSADSRLLYGISSSTGHNYLFSVDLASGTQHRVGDMGAEFTPNTNSQPGLRFTLTPDGQSLTFNTARQVQSLWLMRGFPTGPTGMARVRALLHLP